MHREIASEIEARLSAQALRQGVNVKLEAPVHGSFKDKNVDVAVIHPINGPLLTVGVRSQMSSIGKNILTYTQDIIGEAVSLQDRFPMSVFGYIYLLPLHPADTGTLDHVRYARLFANITGRGNTSFKQERGRYDHFAFALVDFDQDPPQLREDLVEQAQPRADLGLLDITNRLIETYQFRNPWLNYFEN
jgi:hypothetical protein